MKMQVYNLWLPSAFLGAPVLIITLGVSLWSLEKGKIKCGKICREQGYADMRYISGGADEYADECYCLTREEAEYSVLFSKKPIPKGVKVF